MSLLTKLQRAIEEAEAESSQEEQPMDEWLSDLEEAKEHLDSLVAMVTDEVG
jgi:hypothetical protein